MTPKSGLQYRPAQWRRYSARESKIALTGIVHSFNLVYVAIPCGVGRNAAARPQMLESVQRIVMNQYRNRSLCRQNMSGVFDNVLQVVQKNWSSAARFRFNGRGIGACGRRMISTANLAD